MANVGEIRATLTLESTRFQAGLQNARNQLALTSTAAQATDQAIDSIGQGSIISATQLASLRALQAQLGQTSTRASATSLALNNINNTQILGPNVTQNITNVNNGLSNTSTQANRARESMKKLHNVALGMSAAVGVAFAASIASAVNFEQKMKDVEAVAGATGTEMQQLGELAKDMGAKTAFSATEAAMGIEELVKAGLTVTQILDGGLQGALDLATAGGLELAEAAEIASTALNAFRDDNLKVADAANILAGAANASATDVHELKYGLSASAAVAAGVGLTFRDTATALAAFAQNGLKGSDAGTSLKTMLMNLQPSTVAQIDEFERLGLMSYDVTKGLKILADNGIKPASTSFKDVDKSLKSFATTMSGAKAGSEKTNKEYTKLIMQTGILQSSFYDAEGSIKSMDEIAGVLQESLSGMTDAQRGMSLEIMFGSDAIRAGNILYKEGADGINNMWDAMSKVTAAEVAATKLDTLRGSFEELKGVIETIGIEVGEGFLPVLKDITDAITDFLRSLDATDIANAKAALAFAGVAAAIATVLTAIAKVGMALSVFALTPVGAAIIGLSLLGGAFVAAKMHQSEMSEVTLDSVIALEEQRNELSKNISAYDALKSKSQLTNEQLARFVDINSEISKTADPTIIAKLKDEQGWLAEKSGLSNEQLAELVRLNGEILKVVPESNTTLSEQGNVLLNNTDAAKRFNDQQLEMIRLELEAKKTKAEANMSGYLEDEKRLMGEMKDLKVEMNDHDVKEFNQKDKLRNLENELATAKKNNDTLEQERLNSLIERENHKLESIKKQRAESAQAILNKQIEIDKTQAQIGKLDEVKRKMIDIELRQVGLNSKRGEELKTIDSAISKLETQKQKIQNNTSAADKNTQEYREAVGAIDDQIGELNTVRGRVIDITSQAGNMNAALGKDINKTITINQRAGRTIAAVPGQGRGNVGSEFHTGGVLPKLHVGGLAEQFATAPSHNEIDIRALRNEMILTEAQQANLFRMIDAGFTNNGANKSQAPTVDKTEINIAQLVVREEADVDRVADAIERKKKEAKRGHGLR